MALIKSEKLLTLMGVHIFFPHACRFHVDGYREGFEEGQRQGLIEGRNHGLLHGAKLSAEVRIITTHHTTQLGLFCF